MNELLDRPLPNDIDAERAVLGGILLDNSLIAGVVEVVDPADFYSTNHRRVYEAMLGLFSRGSAIDPVLILAELKGENVGGLPFISELTYGLPRVFKLFPYAQRIRETSRIRQLIKTSSRIASEALEAQDDAETLLDRAEADIFAIRDARQLDRMERVSQLADARLEAAEARQASGDTVTGLSTGYTDLDHLLAGLQRTDLVVLAGRPSSGKSGLALNLAENAADTGAIVGFFSLEMSREQLTDRLLSSKSRVDAQRLRVGSLTREEWSHLAAARAQLDDLPLYIDDTAGLTILQLRAKARRLAASMKGLDLIVVDYLQLMRVNKPESRLQEVSQISRDLKALAKEMSVPVLALAQLSRAPDQRADHRPILSDLRESGTIENDADVVAFIYREEQYNRTEENAGTAEVIVAKQRNGPTGTVKLAFLKEYTRFENLWGSHAKTYSY